MLIRAMAHNNIVMDNGATGSNIQYEEARKKWPEWLWELVGHVLPDFMPAKFNVAPQRHVWQIGMRGMVEGNPYWSMMAKKTIEYALQHQEGDGGFQDSNWIHVMGFLEALGRYLRVFEGSLDIPQSRLHGAREYVIENALISHVSGKANIIAATAVMHLMWEPMHISHVGLSKVWLLELLVRQHPDGYFLEKGGWDSSYQAVTLLRLMLYYMYNPYPNLTLEIHEALERGWTWEQSRIKNTGEVDTTGNTRVYPGGEQYGGQEKVVDYPMVILGLIYWSKITNNVFHLQEAQRVIEYAKRMGGRL